MVEIIGNSRVQSASYGMILKNGDIYSYKVYLGEGALEWEEIEDTSQSNN